ncbi:PspC domain-containing protein [Streptomyces sp. 6N223]|uniref:PspC domain-containing protein n=1 Tax=Streptomyces sp. 6N223 TaxID=3457412 RepID=UPI003FD3F2B3
MTGTTEETARPNARLSRSRHHKVIGGVCGGLGRYFNLDPVIFRVSLAVLSVVGGLGFVGYGLAWLIIPFEGEEENEGRRLLSGRVEGPGLTALLFIVAGCGLMLAGLTDGGGATWFSVMMIAALAGAAHWSRRRSETELGGEAEGGAGVDAVTANAVADAPPEAQPPPAPAGPSWWRRSPDDPTAAERASDYLWGPAGARPPARRTVPPPAPPAATQPPPAVAPRERRDIRMGGLVLLLALGAGAGGTAVAWERDSLSEALVLGLAAALAVFGLGLVVSSFAGRLGGGTIVAVALTAGLLAGAAALPQNIATTWSEPVWRPAEAAQVRQVYEVGTGRAELDLGGLAVPEGERVATELEAGAGELVVTVPRNVELTVHVEIAVGAFTYDGQPGGGNDGGTFDSWAGVGQERTVSYAPEAGVAEGGSVELWLEMGIGQVTVEREAVS